MPVQSNLKKNILKQLLKSIKNACSYSTCIYKINEVLDKRGMVTLYYKDNADLEST